MTTFTHLLPEVTELLTLPKTERIQNCQQDKWIGYTRAVSVLKRLDDILVYPRTLRMANILVVGRSGNGKSSLLERFINRHPIQINESGSAVMPILRIEMPETPDESELWSLMLWAMAVSHREKDPASIKKRQVKSLLVHSQVRLIVIDEFNNLARAGKAAGDLLAAIKGLSNELRLSVVAAGTQEAVNALNSDPQMKSRFEPAVLDRWKLDQEYLRFLMSYERLLPLAEPSNLASRELAPKIYGMAGDTIGGAVKLLKIAAAKAIETGTECITPALLDRLEWTRSDQWDEVGRRA
jgi:Bacterial TniB protein